MIVDTAHFPIVFLRSVEGNDAPPEAALNAVLDRETPFVLITDHSPDDHGEDTPDERRERALFFKTIKARMKRYCLGMIVIDSGKAANGAIRLAAATASKAFGFEVGFETAEASAVARAQGLLARKSL